jgi:hypothetical protein
MVRFLVACVERDEALAQSGLPACSWMARWAEEEPPFDAKADQHMAHLRRAEDHVKSCATCQAREQFVRERFPDMPQPPVAGWVRVIGAVAAWIEARPEWLRPACYGAAVLAAMTLLRAAFILLGRARDPRAILMALGAVVAAALAGAGGGLVYSFLGRPLRRIPIVGPYLAGIIAVAGYIGCIVALMAALGQDELTKGGIGTSLVVFGIMSILAGLIVGHQWLRPDKVDG